MLGCFARRSSFYEEQPRWCLARRSSSEPAPIETETPALQVAVPDGEASPLPPESGALATIASIPEEAVWLASHKSERTRRAYRKNVTDFMGFLGIQSAEFLRSATHAHIIAWERHLREERGYASSTVRRRLAAVSRRPGRRPIPTPRCSCRQRTTGTPMSPPPSCATPTLTPSTAS